MSEPLTTTPGTPGTIGVPLPMDQIAAFCARRKVVDFSLFGSAVRDDFSPRSDVDVLLTFATRTQYSLYQLAAMKLELERIFGRSVDVLDRAAVEAMSNPYRQQAILEEARTVYASR